MEVCESGSRGIELLNGGCLQNPPAAGMVTLGEVYGLSGWALKNCHITSVVSISFLVHVLSATSFTVIIRAEIRKDNVL